MPFTNITAYTKAGLGAAVLCWLVYLLFGRRTKIAFALWFPLTALSGFGTLAWIAAVFGMFSSGHDAGLKAFALAIYLLPSPFIFGISILCRPPSDSYRPTVVISSVALWGAWALSLSIAEERTSAVSVHITVVDPSGKPVQGVSVRRSEGMTEGPHTETDELGKTTLQTTFGSNPGGQFSVAGYRLVHFAFRIPTASSAPLKGAFHVFMDGREIVTTQHEYPFKNAHEADVTYILLPKK